MEKSAVFFSRNTNDEIRQAICCELEGITEPKSSKYLGLPMVIGMTKKQVFHYIKERVEQRVNNWKCQFLSPAGKEIMLKAVALALPVYCLSCFKVPKGVCDEIASVLSNFWWGQQDREHKTHWLAWRKMTKEKERGGLGLKDLQGFNDALLAKQLWRLITNPNSLMSRVIKHKYFPMCDLFQAKITSQASWLWRSWASARYLLQEGCRWRVGDGRTVRVWEDKWLSADHLPKPVFPKLKHCGIQVVADLRHPGGQGWHLTELQKIFMEEEIALIYKVPLSSLGTKDKLVWTKNCQGIYDVASGYKLAMQIQRHRTGRMESSHSENDDRQLWRKFWGLNVKRKILHFLWRGINNSLPVMQNVFRRGMRCTPICCNMWGKTRNN